MLARAVTRTGCEPAENIKFSIPNAARAGRAEIARSLAPKAILLHRVGVDPKQFRNLAAIKRAAFRGVGEQLAKLVEGHFGHRSSLSTARLLIEVLAATANAGLGFSADAPEATGGPPYTGQGGPVS